LGVEAGGRPAAPAKHRVYYQTVRHATVAAVAPRDATGQACAMSLLGTDDQHSGPRPGGITGRGWSPGRSGNPKGRPKSPVDIAALAREHGPRCIEDATELLEDPDPRIRLAALVVLMDRGFLEASDACHSYRRHTVADAPALGCRQDV